MPQASYCEQCPLLLQKLNSCATKPNFADNSLLGNLFEFSMMFFSAFPYFLVATIVIWSIFNKTTRGFFLTFLLLFQNFICEMLIKNFYEDPRPEGSCGRGFGFPSSHASFCSSLFIWFLHFIDNSMIKVFGGAFLRMFLESYFMKNTAVFKKWEYYTLTRNSFFLMTPFVLYSRVYLNYHTLEQVLYGMLFGGSFAMVLFIYMMNNVLHPKFLPRAYGKSEENNFLIQMFQSYNFKNNLLDQTYLNKQFDELKNIHDTVDNIKTNLKTKKEDLQSKIDTLKKQGYGENLK